MKKKLLPLAALATIFAACSNNDVPQNSLKDMPITVSVGVADLTTRAGHDNTNLPEKFYLSIDQVGMDYDYANVLMTKSTGNAYTTDSQLLWAGGADNEVIATAATFSLDGAKDLEVQTDQSTADAVKTSDHLLMAEKSVTPSAEGISVEFSHIMSKVMLTITLGDEFNETSNPISDVAFKGTVASNSYTAGTGWAEIATGTEATDIVPFCNAYTAPTTEKSNATAEYEVILVPQTVDANTFTVVFNVGDRVFRWTSANEVKLESGYKYTLNLTAGKDKVSSATFSSYAWNNGDNLNGETE